MIRCFELLLSWLERKKGILKRENDPKMADICYIIVYAEFPIISDSHFALASGTK